MTKQQIELLTLLLEAGPLSVAGAVALLTATRAVGSAVESSVRNRLNILVQLGLAHRGLTRENECYLEASRGAYFISDIGLQALRGRKHE